MSQDAIVGVELPQDDEDGIGQAAVRRHYIGMGRSFELLRTQLASLRGRGYYVYRLEVRWPRKGKPETLLVAKAYHVDGPVVGFYGGHGVIEVLMGFARKLLSGTQEWFPDDFPPDDHHEKFAWLVKNSYDFEG